MFPAGLGLRFRPDGYRDGEDRGQAVVETALVLPVLFIGMLLMVQTGLVVRDALALQLAAREGARAASVSASDEEVEAAVRRSAGGLEAGRIVVGIAPGAGQRRRGEPVTVSLSYEERMRIPVVDRLVDLDLPLRASATMRLELSGPTPAPTPALSSPSPTPSPSSIPVASASSAPSASPIPAHSPAPSVSPSPAPAPSPP